MNRVILSLVIVLFTCIKLNSQLKDNNNFSSYLDKEPLLEEFLSSFNSSILNTNDKPLEDFLFFEDQVKLNYENYTLITDINQHLSWEEYKHILIDKNNLKNQLSHQLRTQFSDEVDYIIVDITEVIQREEYNISFLNIDNGNSLAFNKIFIKKISNDNQSAYKIIDFLTPLGYNSVLDISQLDFIIQYNASEKYHSNPIIFKHDELKDAFKAYSEMYLLQGQPKQLIEYYENNFNKLEPFTSFANEKYSSSILMNNSIEKIDELLNASKTNNDLDDNIIMLINAYLTFNYYKNEEQKQSYFKKAYDRLNEVAIKNNMDLLNYQLFRIGTSPVFMNQWTEREDRAFHEFLDNAILTPNNLILFLQMAMFHQKLEEFSKALRLTKVNCKQYKISPNMLENHLKSSDDALEKKINEQIISHPEFIAWKKEIDK